MNFKQYFLKESRWHWSDYYMTSTGDPEVVIPKDWRDDIDAVSAILGEICDNVSDINECIDQAVQHIEYFWSGRWHPKASKQKKIVMQELEQELQLNTQIIDDGEEEKVFEDQKLKKVFYGALNILKQKYKDLR